MSLLEAIRVELKSLLQSGATMRFRSTRRSFLHASMVGAFSAGMSTRVFGASPAILLDPSQSKADAKGITFNSDMEPLVRWIEETPRDRILEVAIGHLKAGLPPRDLMAGIFLAGIRDIQPRPVGFKFHAVLVIHSAHLMSQTVSPREQLLPMLWALDTFKASQAADVKEGDWTMGKLDNARLPSSSKAKAEFIRAMETWDVEAADVATASLCRNFGAAEVMELYWRFGIRDQRNIGHKAIFTAQAWRTLQAIGWQHAEPVLRSLTYGLLDRQGNPGTDVIGPYQQNLELTEDVHEEWMATHVIDIEGSKNLIRGMGAEVGSMPAADIVEFLNGGIPAEALWEGIGVAANELLIRKPGIIALHAMTSVNALHQVFLASGDVQTRLMSLLQAASWTGIFRSAIGEAPVIKLDELEPIAMKGDLNAMREEVFQTIHENRTSAAAKALYYLENGGSIESIYQVARNLVIDKAQDSHDYKFTIAAWEETRLASRPKWRSLITAASMARFLSPTQPDNPYMVQAREAVKSIL